MFCTQNCLLLILKECNFLNHCLLIAAMHFYSILFSLLRLLAEKEQNPKKDMKFYYGPQRKKIGNGA